MTFELMLSLCFQVFKYFCDDLTNDGLLQMLRVIKKDLKPARHQEPDSEEDDEDFLGIEEDEIDEAETGETGEIEEQTDDSEAVVEAEEGVMESPEDSDDSDGGMDDDAMFRMDTYLAQIFKERKNQAGGETAQSQLVLFKLRVLSLLEIYLHENPGKYIVILVRSAVILGLIRKFHPLINKVSHSLLFFRHPSICWKLLALYASSVGEVPF